MAKDSWDARSKGSRYNKPKKNKAGIYEYKKDKRKKANKGADCFVSTVCFGESSIETQIFRNWRDSYLLEKYWGKKFVSWYYENGEKLSHVIGNSIILKKSAQFVLSQFATFLKLFTRR